MKRCGWHRNRCSGSSCRAAWLNPASAGFTRRAAGPTIPPEQLLLALLLQAIYSIRSGRMLVEQLDCWRRAGLLSAEQVFCHQTRESSNLASAVATMPSPATPQTAGALTS